MNCARYRGPSVLLIVIAIVISAIACAAALHVIRTIVDIADDLCMSTLSDQHLDAEAQTLLNGRTARQACDDVAVSRAFVDQVKMSSKMAVRRVSATQKRAAE